MGRSITRPRELFLSHAHDDRDFADRLARVLQPHNVPVWYSRTSLRPSQRWSGEIGRALARCDWFAVVISPASARSMWVRRELDYALRKKRYADRILPLHVRTCNVEKLSWVLEEFQMIDFRRRFRKACAELLSIWGLDGNSPDLSVKPLAPQRPGRRTSRAAG